MHEQVAIPRAEDEVGSELERISAEPMLPEPAGLRASACRGVVPAQKVKQVPRFQFRSFVGGPLGINEQWEGYAGFLAKHAGVVHVAESNRRQRSARLLKRILVLAQLRDMLAAEDSPVVPEEDHDRGVPLPQRTEPNFQTAGFRKHDVCQPCADRSCHS